MAWPLGKKTKPGFNGPYRVEVSSAIKYAFLARPQAGTIEVTDRARQAIRHKTPGDDIEALRFRARRERVRRWGQTALRRVKRAGPKTVTIAVTTLRFP
jgi:hypothetical protein